MQNLNTSLHNFKIIKYSQWSVGLQSLYCNFIGLLKQSRLLITWTEFIEIYKFHFMIYIALSMFLDMYALLRA